MSKKVSSQSGFAKWAKENQGLLIKSGLVAGGGIFIVYILKATGLIKSSAEKKAEAKLQAEIDKNKTSPDSPFSPNYSGSTQNLLTDIQARNFAETIYDAIGWIWDDESAIYAVFRQLKNKAQVAQLADVFFQMFQEDLYGYLADSLNSDELNTINQIVNQLKS